MKFRTRILAFFLGNLIAGGHLVAATVGYDGEYKADYTDNAFQAQGDEEKIDELTHNYRVGFFANLSGARSKTDFVANLEFVDYQDDLTEDQALSSFMGSSEIALTSRTLTWLIADALGYYDTDPGLKFNKRNQERVNYFVTGPILKHQVGPGTNIGSKLLYTNHNRNGRAEDYNKANLDISWDQHLNVRDNWGVNVDHILMLYPDEAERDDYSTTDLKVYFDRKTPSNAYAISVGGTYLQTKNDGNDSSAIFNATWDHSFTRRTGLVLEAGYQLTDASVLNDTQLNQTGQFESSSESGLYYEKQVGTRFRYLGVSSEFDIGIDARSLEYVDGPVQASFASNDHNTYGVSSAFRKFVGRTLNVELELAADQKEYIDTELEDKLYTASITSNYIVSRSLEMSLKLEHQEGEGNLPSADGTTGVRTYDENIVSIGIHWDPYKSRRSTQGASEFNLSIIN